MNQALSNTLVDHLLGLTKKDWHGLLRAAAKEEEKEAAERVRQHEASRQAGTRPSRGAAAYVGGYEHPAFGTATVALENSGLVWSWSSFRSPVRHWHYDTFTVADDWLGEVEVVFRLDGDGEVAALKMVGGPDVEFTRVKARPASP